MIGGTVSPVERAKKQLTLLFPDDPGHREAVAWASAVLQNAQLDPSAAPLRSLRALRRADRRLGGVTARYLVDAAAGTAAGGSASGEPAPGVTAPRVRVRRSSASS